MRRASSNASKRLRGDLGGAGGEVVPDLLDDARPVAQVAVVVFDPVALAVEQGVGAEHGRIELEGRLAAPADALASADAVERQALGGVVAELGDGGLEDGGHPR